MRPRRVAPPPDYHYAPPPPARPRVRSVCPNVFSEIRAIRVDVVDATELRDSRVSFPGRDPRALVAMWPPRVLLLTLLLAAPSALAIRRLRPAHASVPEDLQQLPSRPDYIECQESSECDDDHCCVLGADRYSIPTCRPMQSLGNVCRPSGQVPMNTTVGYPDQSQVELSIFWLFCPCAEGLYCQRESHSCQAVY